MTIPLSEAERAELQSHIDEDGFGRVFADLGTHPRYFYTIGLYRHLGYELILAGCYGWTKDEALEVLWQLGHQLLRRSRRCAARISDRVKTELGTVRLVPCHRSWTAPMLSGAAQYWSLRHVPAKQVVPLGPAATIELPDMHEPLDPSTSRCWAPLLEPSHACSHCGKRAVVDVAVLRTGGVARVMHYEDRSWFMFGEAPTTTVEDLRELPLEALFALDPTLEALLDLPVGEEALRDGVGNSWRHRRIVVTSEHQGHWNRAEA